MKTLNLDNAQIIADNDEAIRLLLAENALSGLRPDPPYDTCNGFWGSTDTNAYIYASNSRVSGDEGYVIILFPFEHYTLKQAALLYAILVNENNREPENTRYYEQDMANPQN